MLVKALSDRVDTGDYRYENWCQDGEPQGRAALLVLDSVGIGGAADAQKFGDEGADTLGNIRDYEERLYNSLELETLSKLGLWDAHYCSQYGSPPPQPLQTASSWAVASSHANGKDTTSGHWEIAYAPADRPFTTFEDVTPCFPADLVQALIAQADLPGVLGNCHASGTQIIAELGQDHITSGKPIIYGSADSVLQIAAHEDSFGLDRLYRLCEIARRLSDPYMIGRVIARPFTGSAGEFTRTLNRRDYAMPPFSKTLLDDVSAAGRDVFGVGKISDIFAGRGITKSYKAHGVGGTLAATCEAFDAVPAGGLVFSNIVEFDSEYGHRRNTRGYADALRKLDEVLNALLIRVTCRDLLIITADHGNDPTWKGTDHTREQVPVLIYSPGMPMIQKTNCDFSDIGASIAHFLGVQPSGSGTSFLRM